MLWFGHLSHEFDIIRDQVKNFFCDLDLEVIDMGGGDDE